MGLPNLFREPFAMQVFLSRHPCVWNSLSRAFAENMWHKFPIFRSEVRIETFNFQAQRTSFFSSYRCGNMWIDIASGGLLLLHLLVLHPTPNRELQISVGTAGPQPRAPNFSGHCRTPTATADLSGHSQTPQAPDLSGHCHSPIKWGGGPSQLVRTFADPSRSFREAFADFRVTSIEICE